MFSSSWKTEILATGKILLKGLCSQKEKRHSKNISKRLLQQESCWGSYLFAHHRNSEKTRNIIKIASLGPMEEMKKAFQD